MGKGKHSKHKQLPKKQVIVNSVIAALALSAIGSTFAFMPHYTGTPIEATRVQHAEAANRSMARESLLTEAVGVDTSDDPAWKGTDLDDVKKNIDSMTKHNDDAAQAKESLRKAISEANKTDFDKYTEATVQSLKDEVKKAQGVVALEQLQSQSVYDSRLQALKKAVDGLTVKPVPVQEPPAQSNDTGTSNQGGTSSLGVTVPVGVMQQWFHDHLLSNGYTEDDFSAGVWIINHESGWNPKAVNSSSGAYGLAQALPGSKMASHGADWQSNYQTQLRWFIDYCHDRYGSIQGAYQFWQANHWY